MKTKTWTATKTLFQSVAKELGLKIDEFCFISKHGCDRRRPVEGCECTGVILNLKGKPLLRVAEFHGYRKSYNGGYRADFGETNVCYVKVFPRCTSKWGNTVQIWPNGLARLVG